MLLGDLKLSKLLQVLVAFVVDEGAASPSLRSRYDPKRLGLRG